MRTFFPLYSSMSKQHQLAKAACIPNMKVLFDASVTSPLLEIYEDVGIFYFQLTREDMLLSYDLNKILTSLAIAHHNFVDLKEAKLFAVLLLQNVKENSCIR